MTRNQIIERIRTITKIETLIVVLLAMVFLIVGVLIGSLDSARSSRSQGFFLEAERLSQTASRIGFDGYMYLSILKYLDAGDESEARQVAAGALQVKTVELEQLLKSNIPKKDREAAERFIQRAKTYQNRSKN